MATQVVTDRLSCHSMAMRPLTDCLHRHEMAAQVVMVHLRRNQRAWWLGSRSRRYRDEARKLPFASSMTAEESSA